MADKARLQIKGTADPERWDDVGTGSAGVPIPVDIESSALPSGAATSANQTNGSQKTQVIDSAGHGIDVDTTGAVYSNLKAYRSSDGTYQPLRLDKATNSLQIVSYEHHEVHAGSFFRTGMNYSLSNGQVATLGFTTPNTTKWAHVRWFLETSSDGIFTVLEDVTSFAGGVTLTPLNHNRNSSVASTMTVIRGVTGDNLITPTGGTTMLNAILSTGKGSEVSAGHGEEFIFKQNSNYLFRYTNGTSANVIRFVVEYYEHTDIA